MNTLPSVVGRRYDTGESVRLDVAAGRIANVSPCNAALHEPWIAPGFIDLQINGYGGQEFSAANLTPDRAAEVVRSQYAHGVTRLCPTVTTNAASTLLHALGTIAEACQEFPDIALSVAGIHLEGPYLSREDGPRGAHPAEHCRPPDWDEFRRFQEAAGGRIRILTMSPEFEGSAEFIRQVCESGVAVAIGHTSANSQQIRAAADAGASLSTHLGNGAHRTLRRHPNYLWDQLADDRLAASLIVDGRHLPPEVVKTFVRAKSPERIVLVSDLSGLAGMPPGIYHTELCELEILPDGRLVIAGQDQLLAGASAPISAGVANVIGMADIDLKTAVEMASRHPARILRVDPPEIASEHRADLVWFQLGLNDQASTCNDLTIMRTMLAGEVVYERGGG